MVDVIRRGDALPRRPRDASPSSPQHSSPDLIPASRAATRHKCVFVCSTGRIRYAYSTFLHLAVRAESRQQCPASGRECSSSSWSWRRACGRSTRLTSKIKLGLDLNGGVHLVLRVKPRTANGMRGDTVQQALHTIERRVNELGVAEPVVARYTRGRSDSRAAAGRGRRRPREADHQVDGAAPAHAGRAWAISGPRGRVAGVRPLAAAGPGGAAGANRHARAPRRPPSTSSRKRRWWRATTCATPVSRSTSSIARPLRSR